MRHCAVTVNREVKGFGLGGGQVVYQAQAGVFQKTSQLENVAAFKATRDLGHK